MRNFHGGQTRLSEMINILFIYFSGFFKKQKVKKWQYF